MSFENKSEDRMIADLCDSVIKESIDSHMFFVSRFFGDDTDLTYINDNEIKTTGDLKELAQNMSLSAFVSYFREHLVFSDLDFDAWADDILDDFDEEGFEQGVLASGIYDEVIKGYSGTGNDEDDLSEFLLDAGNDYFDKQADLIHDVCYYARQHWNDVIERVAVGLAKKYWYLVN